MIALAASQLRPARYCREPPGPRPVAPTALATASRLLVRRRPPPLLPFRRGREAEPTLPGAPSPRGAALSRGS